MLELACFDFDGTLFSTELIHRQSIESVLAQECNVIISAEESAVHSGTPYIDRITLMLRLRDLYVEDLAWELERKARALTAAACENAKGLLTPGVENLLKDLKHNGVQMVVVSSGKRVIIEHDLQNAGIQNYFESIIAIEDVVNRKPDPEPYLKALEDFGVSANNAIAFEDSPHGLQSALSAGITTIGILTSAHADELIGAERTVRDFTTLSFDKITDIISRR